jgi:hypothetical protein
MIDNTDEQEIEEEKKQQEELFVFVPSFAHFYSKYN